MLFTPSYDVVNIYVVIHRAMMYVPNYVVHMWANRIRLAVTCTYLVMWILPYTSAEAVRISKIIYTCAKPNTLLYLKRSLGFCLTPV